jgi:S1-C subfamily serine protease
MPECRCGYQHADGPLDFVSEAEPSRPSGGNSLMSWLVIGTVALIAAGTLVALQVAPAKRQPVAAAPAAESVARVDATPGPAAESITPPSLPSLETVEPLAPVITPSSTTSEPISLEDVVSNSLPAIVSIETSQGRGSGFFAAPRTVLTNRHVITNNVSVSVRLSSGQTLPGRVEASSTDFDLAIVKVDGASPTQPLLPLGTVMGVRPGQEVIAIGLALGMFQNTVTRGIISGIRQTDRVTILQTDAAINPGNSGGPLLNRNGQVVGINTMKISGAAESLGFAIAIDHARGLLNGGRPSESPRSTSASRSEPLSTAFAGRSSTDEMRDEGVRNYDKTMAVVARRAAQLDDYWTRIKQSCAVRVAPGYDREWFGLWDGRTILTSPEASCISATNDLKDLAAEVRNVVMTAQDNARRASVLPGQLRDVRRRYRMDWTGFER